MIAMDAWIDEQVTIPDLLQSAPGVRPILDRYGLAASGPGRLVSIRVFAQVHDVPLRRLLNELQTASEQAMPEALPSERPGCLHCGGRLHS